jgi:hypothetical protein
MSSQWNNFRSTPVSIGIQSIANQFKSMLKCVLRMPVSAEGTRFHKRMKSDKYNVFILRTRRVSGESKRAILENVICLESARESLTMPQCLNTVIEAAPTIRKTTIATAVTRSLKFCEDFGLFFLLAFS